MKLARLIAVAPIRAYQLVFSPMVGERCKYYPSCSEYAVQAVGRFGVLRGFVLAGWRLLRCNPWSRGGFDPVEEQHLFKCGDCAPDHAVAPERAVAPDHPAVSGRPC